MNSFSSLLPTTRAATRRVPLRASNRRRLPSSAALLSTSQPLHDAGIRQAHPRGAYYDILLTSPPPYSAIKSEGPPSTAKPVPASPKPSPVTAPASFSSFSSSSPSSPTSSTPQKAAATSTSAKPNAEPKPKTASERARIVFGSRLAGPAQRAERLAQMRDRSQMIAGVLVPPRPEEPDNCCMSGCVDCVWDRYRDEMEGWAQASAEASRRLKAQEGGVAAAIVAGTGGVASSLAQPSATSMDDDGGGSNTNWDMAPPPLPQPGPGPDKGGSDFWDDELYKSLPVGIREFMKQEKRLKQKHLREGTMGG